MTTLHPAPGVSVGERYELVSRIAGGGMGEVWAARDQVLGREVAVKLLRGEHADDPAFLARFRTEARHAASLSHPGIASVYDYGEDDGTAFLVMELVPGEPLSARLAREGALTPAVAVPLLQQAAAAVQAAHDAGLVHRDVKPANLLITPSHEVKVTDFGIARLGGQEPVTRTGEVMGTAQYLSPEQALGHPATSASDVYSLGVVSYEALAGRRPFEGETPVAVAMAHVQRTPDPLPASVPPALAAVVAQAMAKDPARRPASAAAFGAALGSALAASAPTQPLAVGVPAASAPTAVLRPGGAAFGATAGSAGARLAALVFAVRAWVSERSRRELALGVVAVLAAGAVLLALLMSQGGAAPGASANTSTTTSRTSRPSTTTATPTAIVLNPAAYVGRPSSQVVDALKALGLRPITAVVLTDQAASGTVLGFSPPGPFQRGATVTVLVAQPPANNGPGEGKGRKNHD